MKKVVSLLFVLATMIIADKLSAQCSTPTQFEVKESFIEETSARCFWNVNDAPYDFRIYWKKSSESEFVNSDDVSGTLSYKMENLKKGTQYDCYMVKICGENSISAPTSIVTFTTLGVADEDDEYLIADMEDITILSNQYELPSLTNFDIDYYDNSKHKNYVSNTLVFAGVVEPTYSMAIGWGISSIVNPTFATATQESGDGYDVKYYTSSAMAAYETDGKNYLFGYYSPWNSEEHLTVYDKDNKYFEPKGVYVSQSLSTYNFTSEQEDLYLKVIATGYDKYGSVTGSNFIYLINKQAGEIGNPSSWQLLDLSPLGKVAKVKFTLENNDETYWLSNYFCIDNFVYTQAEDIEIETLDKEICANENYMGLEQSGTYNIDWTIVNLTVKEEIVNNIEVTVSSDELPYEFGELLLTENGDYEQHFTAEDGCDSVVYLSFKINNYIEDITSSFAIDIFPNPIKSNVSNEITINCPYYEGDITIINNVGQVVYKSNINQRLNINVKDLQSGVYYVKTGNITKKLIIQ